MLILHKGTPKENLKALKIPEELADKSKLPLLRKDFKIYEFRDS